MNIQIDEQTHKKILQGLRNLNDDCCLCDWEKTAAYWGLVLKCDPNPSSAKVGDLLTLLVDCQVSCKEGEEFSMTIDIDEEYCDGFVTMKVLDIKEKGEYRAELKVRVVARGDRLSFVKPVPDEEKQRLRESRTYDYDRHQVNEHIGYISDNMIILEDTGCGAISAIDYIYVDNDGIDHLVLSCRSYTSDPYAYFGDKVLGYHEYNNYFEQPRKMSDGSLSPEIDKDFMCSLRERSCKEGLVPCMQSYLKNLSISKNDHRSFPHSQCHSAVTFSFYSWAILNYEVDALLSAFKILIEESEEIKDASIYEEAMKLYEELVRKVTCQESGENKCVL